MQLGLLLTLAAVVRKAELIIHFLKKITGKKMFSLLKKLFNVKSSIVTEDPDFGSIRYVEPTKEYPYGYWQMEHKIDVDYQTHPISFTEIPGDESGLFEDTRKLALEKIKSLEAIWDLCDSELRGFINESLKNIDYDIPKDIFFIDSIAISSKKFKLHEWEVCFQTHDKYKWVYFCLQIQDGNIVSNTIDT